MNNNWKLLQDYIKKINLTSFDLIGKEKQLEKDFDSYVNLFYKYKKKKRKINDNNINILGLDESINQNLIKKKDKSYIRRFRFKFLYFNKKLFT